MGVDLLEVGSYCSSMIRIGRCSGMFPASLHSETSHFRIGELCVHVCVFAEFDQKLLLPLRLLFCELAPPGTFMS